MKYLNDAVYGIVYNSEDVDYRELCIAYNIRDTYSTLVTSENLSDSNHKEMEQLIDLYNTKFNNKLTKVLK